MHSCCLCRHQIRCSTRSVDRSLRHHGIASDIGLFLSKLHVPIPVVHCHWHFVPLDLYAIVSAISWLILLIPLIPLLCDWFMSSLCIHSSTMQGKTSHKFFDPNENFVMRLYYQKDVLTFMCFGNEMFYCGLYLCYFTTGPTCKYFKNIVYCLLLSLSLFLSIRRTKSLSQFHFQCWASHCSKYWRCFRPRWLLLRLESHCCTPMWQPKICP